MNKKVIVAAIAVYFMCMPMLVFGYLATRSITVENSTPYHVKIGYLAIDSNPGFFDLLFTDGWHHGEVKANGTYYKFIKVWGISLRLIRLVVDGNEILIPFAPIKIYAPYNWGTNKKLENGKTIHINVSSGLIKEVHVTLTEEE